MEWALAADFLNGGKLDVGEGPQGSGSRQVYYDANHGNDTPSGYDDPASETGSVLKKLEEGGYAGDMEAFWDDLADAQDSQPQIDCGQSESICGSKPSAELPFVDAIEPTTEGLVLEGNWPDCDALFIALVWGFLRQNRDLVEWAVCMADGGSIVECVLEKLDGTSPHPISIVINGAPDCIGKMNSVIDGHRINICTGNLFGKPTLWSVAGSLFCSLSGGINGLECAVVSVASSLLHEITHSCGATHTNGRTTTRYCGIPFLTGNYFAQAAFTRYPHALESECCVHFRDLAADVGLTLLPNLSLACT